MYACFHTPRFETQAALRFRKELHKLPVAIVEGLPSKELVISCNKQAKQLGIQAGMSRIEVEAFPELRILKRSLQEEQEALSALFACAALFSPRIQMISLQYAAEKSGTLILDIAGTEALFGKPEIVANKLRQRAYEAGLFTRVSVSHNSHAALCAARAFPGITIIPPGQEAEILAPLSLRYLELSSEETLPFTRWGVRTFSALSKLPEHDLVARIGLKGQQLLAQAQGRWIEPFVPVQPDFASELSESLELEDPVEMLESLLFLFGRMLDQLVIRAKAHALAIAAVTVSLKLEREQKQEDDDSEYERVIRPSLPLQDTRTLLKLIQLDLEIHPPAAAILAIRLKAEPAQPNVVQNGLFLPQAPATDRLEVLLARLRKLVGEDRVGSPELCDTHRFDAFHMAPFQPKQQKGSSMDTNYAPTALRICRPPLAITVTLRTGKPVFLIKEGMQYKVLQSSGPWRTNGQWWSQERWCREEWDVVLSAQDAQVICRIALDPDSQCWYLQGIYD